MGKLENKIAIVSGAGRGIGQATAVKLAAEGARVVVNDLDEGPAKDTVDAIEAAGGTAVACVGSVTEDGFADRFVHTAVDTYGGLDIVVNNAGIGAQGTVADNTDAEWHRVFDINVVGMVRVSRAALPHLRASNAAAIVNTCSIAATAGLPQRALYSATKGAVLSLTRAMAADHLREGIRVNCVNPGTADTPWIGRLLSAAADPVAERAALEARQPHGRMVSPEEVAGAVAYLASPRSGSTTGVALAVDGGMQELRLRPPGQ